MSFYYSRTGSPQLLLTLATSCAAWQFDLYYNLTLLTPHVDWYNVMCYDLAGTWNPYTGAHTALTTADGSDSVTSGVNMYLAAGVPTSKIVLGLAAYGDSFTLVKSSDHGIGSPSSGGGAAGPVTQEVGQLAWYVTADDGDVAGGWCVSLPRACVCQQWVSE